MVVWERVQHGELDQDSYSDLLQTLAGGLWQKTDEQTGPSDCEIH